MSSGKAHEIRQVIRQARQHAPALGRLRSTLLHGIPHLHRSIQLPEHGGVNALTDFVLRYLDHVPNCLDALRTLTRSTGIHDYAATVLDTAADFFLKPACTTNSQRGLSSLMKRAYLAHRLFEELNDKVLSRCGVPLAPMDMTRANLLMHQLIGERCADDLDRLVQEAMTHHGEREHLMDCSTVQNFAKQQANSNWRGALLQWPCLMEGLSVSLTFGDQQTNKSALISRALH